ncbi:MAG TPA: 3-oxoacyl-[acyl-carrier-protein] reductase [Clostridiales bacterium]|nr:3-oxoacyl-[acyl-carrier-protein] reductase [Clostridiales bacterium]
MLKGKVAVVTGGSRGIGRAICERFAENGANVAFLYSGSAEKAEELKAKLLASGVKAEAYKCNVADFNEVSDTFKRIVADFGTVDILVNNAGITRDKLLLSMREQDFDEVLDVNLKGFFNTIKQVYPILAKKRAGKIINISSISGLIGNPGQANYSASKAGVIGLTKTVAKELASRGVCCNAIAPGFIKTDMTAAFTGENRLVSSIPLGRMGLPEEVASLALFLASPSSDYITGEVIRIDGGLAM